MLAGQLFVTEVRQPSMKTTTWHFLSKCHSWSFTVCGQDHTTWSVSEEQLSLMFSWMNWGWLLAFSGLLRDEKPIQMLNRTQFPQKPCSGRDCCLFWLQHIVRTHWRNQPTPSDTWGIGLEMPVWSFFFLLRKLVGILKRVTHAIIFGLLGLR